ncbi:MAG: hemolysin [Chloroflexi bacterium RBG_16_52_11]|nr:MAG: hemolysin [Chloroflexi bacterium RBG_16_52_11]
MAKTRLDILLTARGLAESRAQAQRLVMAGQVRVAGQVALKPGSRVDSDAEVSIDLGPPFVSRGGEKLQAALERFGVDPTGRTCTDVGASTGGFTDCLLQRGAALVYAIDVGQGILHWKLRQDPRVAVMERTNARYLSRLPGAVDLVTIDASFISLKLLLPVVRGWFELPTGGDPTEAIIRGEVVALIKPQFEAGRQQADRAKGVIRDAAIHSQVLWEVLSAAIEMGYEVRGLMRSPLLGPKGNVEFLAWLVYPAQQDSDLEAMVNEVLSPEDQ